MNFILKLSNKTFQDNFPDNESLSLPDGERIFTLWIGFRESEGSRSREGEERGLEEEYELYSFFALLNHLDLRTSWSL